MPLLKQLEELCRRQPETIALVDEGKPQTSISYGQLWTHLELVSKNLDVQERTIVLCSLRSVKLVVHLLSAWKAGGIPLLLDPEIPDARLKEILSIVEPAGIYRHGEYRAYSSASPGRLFTPGSYLVSTSGSGGVPKVVELSGEGLEGVLAEQIESFGLKPGKRNLWALSPGFDASLSDIGSTLLSGATLVCGAPDCLNRLPDVLRSQSISHLDIPPALLEAYQPSDFPETLETLVVGGAPSRPETLRRWAEHYRVIAVYGPSEATICCSLSQVDLHWDEPYIGQPISDFEFRTQDGELWVAGVGLARAYLDEDSPDQESFAIANGTRWYKTGDLVKESNSNHGLIFLGRSDRQIQWRGQRLELEEIEKRLWPVFGAHKVAALSTGGALNVFWEATGDPLGRLEEAKRILSEQLPKSWQINNWVKLAELPRTSSHKIDYPLLAKRIPSSTFGHLDSLSALSLSLQLERAGHKLDVCQLLGRPTLAVTSDKLKSRLSATPKRAIASRAKKRPTLLITGINGGLGQAICKPLAEHFEVLGLVRQPVHQANHFQGDITQPQLGLNNSDWNELTERVDEVLHLACRLSITADVEELWPVNVDPLRTLSELGTRLHHASSLAVFLQSEPRTIPSSDSLSQARVLIGGYTQTKWAAECLHCDLSGGGHLLRYGQLLGKARQSDLLYRVTKGLVELGCYPRGSQEHCFDVTPLSWAATRTVEILCSGGSRVSNLSSGCRANLRDLIDGIRSAGVGLTEVSASQFFAHVAGSENSGLAQRALARWHPDPNYTKIWRDFDLFLASGLELAPIDSRVDPRTVLDRYVREVLK